MQQLLNLRPLVSQYKGVLLDQFGVLHDGRHPYPKAIEALKFFHDQKVPVYLLSNSSRRSSTAYHRLDSMGFKSDWITEIITSGEMTYQHLLHRKGTFWETLGHRCMHFTWNSRGKIDLQELDLEIVQEPKDADFILAHGTEALGVAHGADPIPHSFEGLCAKLKKFTSLPLLPPMIVANPDFVTVDGDSLSVMPGSLGRFYQAMGGEVIWMGKPGKIIYDHTLLHAHLKSEELIAIGDSIEHDIKGADDAGIDSVFVCGGIHSTELFKNGSVNVSSLDALCSKHAVTPKYYMEFFQLGERQE